MEKIINFRYGNLQLVESGKLNGNMSPSSLYYKPETPRHIINGQVIANRMNFAAGYGVHGTNMFVTDPNYKKTPFEITKEFLETKPKGMVDIPGDILVVTKDTPDIMIGSYVRSLPVIMTYDKEQEILACKLVTDLIYLDDVPGQLVDLLQDEYHSYLQDIVGFVGPSSIDSKKFVKEFYRAGVRTVKVSVIDPSRDKRFFHDGGSNYSGGFIMSENNLQRDKIKSLELKTR